MTRPAIGASLAVIAGTALAPAVSAQALPDIEQSVIQGGQIDEAIAAATRPGAGAIAEDNEIDGEAGVYVLRQNDIFFVAGSAGFSYSDNPVRTAADPGGSAAAEFSTSAGVRTRIAESFDFGMAVTASGIEYFEDFAPSSRNINGTINVGTGIAGSPLYVSAVVFGGVNFDGDFDNGTAFYGASASLSAGFRLGRRAVVHPGVGVTRQWSETEENNSTSVSASMALSHLLAPNVVANADIFYSHRWFDDFYEDVTFVARRDDQYGVGLDIAYRPHENVTLSVAAGYEKRDSSFFLSEFEAFGARAAISAIAHF